MSGSAAERPQPGSRLDARQVAELFGCSRSAARHRMRTAGATRDARGRLTVDAQAIRELALSRAATALAAWGFEPGEVLAALPAPAERWVSTKEASRVLRRRHLDVLQAAVGLESRGDGRRGSPRVYRLADLATVLARTA